MQLRTRLEGFGNPLQPGPPAFRGWTVVRLLAAGLEAAPARFGISHPARVFLQEWEDRRADGHPGGDFLEHRAKPIHLPFHRSGHGLLVGVAGGEPWAPACSGAEPSSPAMSPPRGRLAKASDARRRRGLQLKCFSFIF